MPPGNWQEHYSNTRLVSIIAYNIPNKFSSQFYDLCLLLANLSYTSYIINTKHVQPGYELTVCNVHLIFHQNAKTAHHFSD